MSLKHRLRRFASRFGVQLSRTGLIQTRQRARALEALGIDLVFDVGANTGQYAQELRGVGYRGRILSFEPGQAAYRDLVKAAAGDAAWDCVALGMAAEAGTMTLNIAGNSQSSSVLPMLAAHERADPSSRVVAQEEITLITLAEALDRFQGAAKRVWLKLDVQGLEADILDGGADRLDALTAIQLEVSYLPLYEGEVPMEVLIASLRQHGFVPFSLNQTFGDADGWRALQADILFYRPDTA